MASKLHLYILILAFSAARLGDTAFSGYSKNDQTYHSIPPSSFGIFHSLWDIHHIVKDIPEIMNIPQVFDLFEKMRQNQIVQLPRGPRKPFIVIEGVKGSGKSSIAIKFAKSFNGTYLRSPPEYFAPFKGWVQTRNKLERNAFHALSNYLIAEEAKRLMATRMVVMDLYWHGLVAYELSRLSGATGVLPVTSAPVYKFPEDLLVPDIPFYLLVLEDKRYYREKETGKPAISTKIREIMFRAYSKFYKPRLVPVFADRGQEDVGEEIRNMTCRILQGLI